MSDISIVQRVDKSEHFIEIISRKFNKNYQYYFS